MPSPTTQPTTVGRALLLQALRCFQIDLSPERVYIRNLQDKAKKKKIVVSGSRLEKNRVGWSILLFLLFLFFFKFVSLLSEN